MTLRPRGLNLTAALAVIAILDLVAHRLVARLFLPQEPNDTVRTLAASVARFVFHLGGVLGLLVVVTALVRVLVRNDLFPRTMRFAAGTIAMFFAAIGALGVFSIAMPDRMLVHLKTTHAFLCWFIMLGLWRSPGPLRGKVGVTLFGVPTVLHALALFSERAGWGGPFPGELARAGEIGALFAAALAPYLLSPEFPQTGPPPRRRALGVAAGVVALFATVTTLALRFDLVQTLALYGFRLDLPPLASAGALTYVGLVIAAFVGICMALVWTVGAGGPSRLVGYGLVLVTASGVQPVAPSLVMFATCGLMAMAAGTVRLTMSTTPVRTAAAAV